ncbi:MAG: hypothetical protein J6A26_06150 [Oscillospiraceae bacterium]|nr:hypothetical protein [Oscillospiraceae bacterium]
MEWTPAKLRYLLAFHTLNLQNDQGSSVRCIDIAIHLGISRASSSRMLTQFVEDGILTNSGKSGFQLTELGLRETEHYYAQFESLYHLFCDKLGLSDFDARECAVNLITSLPDNIAEDLRSKCQQFLQLSLPSQS